MYSSFEEYSIAREKARLEKVSRAIATEEQEKTTAANDKDDSQNVATKPAITPEEPPQTALSPSLELLSQSTIPLADQLCENGIAALNQGGFEAAIKLFSQAIAANPNLVEAYNNRGIARGEIGLFQEALADFDQALTLDAQCAAAYYARGTTHHKLGQAQQSYNDLSQAIALAPQWVDPYINRGLILTNSGLRSDALDDFNQALAIEPNNINALINRSSLYVRTGNYEGALVDADLILSLDQNNATAHNNRGIALAGLGNNIPAKQALQTALNLFTQQCDSEGQFRAQKFLNTLFS